jgi:hypothetical protein
LVDMFVSALLAMIIRYCNWGVKPVYSFVWLVVPVLPLAAIDRGAFQHTVIITEKVRYGPDKQVAYYPITLSLYPMRCCTTRRSVQ